MSKIEDKIRKNKDHFDDAEPLEGHFERFRNKLSDQYSEKKPENKYSFKLMIKIAASVIILIAIALVFLIKPSESKSVFAINALEKKNLPKELTELGKYYSQQTKQKVCEIDELTKTCCEDNDFQKIAQDQIKEIEENRKELQKEYLENKGDERTFSAIVNNYRLTSKVLDRIIETIKNNI